MLSGCHPFDLKQREGIQGSVPLNMAKAAGLVWKGEILSTHHQLLECLTGNGGFNRSDQGGVKLTTSSCSPPGSRSPCAGEGTAPSGA